jgi:hypothetical protein
LTTVALQLSVCGDSSRREATPLLPPTTTTTTMPTLVIK